MKKYLLSLLIVGLSFIGFSNAENFSCEWSSSLNATCTPNQFTLSESFINGTHTITGNPNAEYTLWYKDVNDNVMKLTCNNNNCELSSPDMSLEDILSMIDGFPDPFIINNSLCVNPENLNEVPTAEFCNASNVGGSEGGNTGGDSELIGQLSPVITGLENSINEFIPYVVYVGLGVLGVIIGFFAIKRLINRTRSKSLGVFSSRRRRK